MNTLLTVDARNMRKVLRALDQVEAIQILDILKERALYRFTDTARFFDSVSTGGVKSSAYVWSGSNPIAYQDFIELDADDMAVLENGEIEASFEEQVTFMGIHIRASINARCKVPEEDLTLLRRLGKSTWVVPERKPYEAFTCQS